MNQTHARAPFVIAATTVLLTVCLAFGDDFSRWAARLPAEIFVFRSSCANNLKQIGLAFKWHANENSGKFPQLSPEPGKLMFKWDDVYPQYLKDKEIMICPGKDESEQFDVFDDRDYIYWGYLITNDEDATLFVDAYNAQIETGGEFPNFLMSPSSYGSYFARMSENVGRYLITDINNPPDGIPTDSEVPAMMEWPNNHQPHWGGNVLYVDGHIEWVPYGTFPMTDTMINALTEIAGMQPVTAYAQLDPVYFENDPNGYTRDCANQHKQFGLSLKMYAGEHNGNFPPLNPEAGRLTVLPEELFPEYFADLEVLTCPGALAAAEHEEFDDHHYVYPGYLLTNDDDAELFVNAYAAEIAAAGDFTGPLSTPSTYGDEFLPFHENMQQFLTQEVEDPGDDIVSDRTTPVLIEWPGNHEGQMGGHVLYLDGHVEWIPYPGKFPMTERTIAALDAIADWTPTTEWMPPHPAYTLENDPYHFNRQCKSRIRGLYLAAVSYAFQTPNWPQPYPDLPTEIGQLMFAANDMFPQSLVDPYLMVCPGPVPPSPLEHFDDQHYIYLGYALTGDDDVEAFVTAYDAQLAAGGDFTGDLDGPSSYGDVFLHFDRAIRNIVSNPGHPDERVTAKNEIPMFIEWPGNHAGLFGGHVVFLDGSVKWMPYPGEFPMTPTTIGSLAALADPPPVAQWATQSFTWENDPHQQALCQYNMSILRTAAFLYANDNKTRSEFYPDLSSVPNVMMFAEDQVLPFYLHDTIRLNCPGSRLAHEPPSVSGQSYVYLGYAVKDEAELARFADAYHDRIAASDGFADDITDGAGSIYHLRRSFETGADSLIEWSLDGPLPRNLPVLIEWPDSHTGLRGGNVMFMDGRVEWSDYPGEFPMTEYAMSILTDLAGRSPIRSIKSDEEVAESVNTRDAFSDLDTDADGLLTLLESGLSAQMFAVLDLDNDGYISMAELLEISVGPVGQATTVYVDFDHDANERGTQNEPFNTLMEAANFVATGGHVRIAPGMTPETPSIIGGMTLLREGETGEVIIGAP